LRIRIIYRHLTSHSSGFNSIGSQCDRRAHKSVRANASDTSPRVHYDGTGLQGRALHGGSQRFGLRARITLYAPWITSFKTHTVVGVAAESPRTRNIVPHKLVSASQRVLERRAAIINLVQRGPQTVVRPKPCRYQKTCKPLHGDAGGGERGFSNGELPKGTACHLFMEAITSTEFLPDTNGYGHIPGTIIGLRRTLAPQHEQRGLFQQGPLDGSHFLQARKAARSAPFTSSIPNRAGNLGCRLETLPKKMHI